MECKNCELPLRTDYSFCSNCGAKIIRNRLNFKNLWYDVTERYFNVNNTFLKTFWHLFIKPESVIISYIEGVRKKYLNPISYFGIALTLSGILVFFIKKFFFEAINFDENFQGATPAFADKWKDITFDYSSLFFVSYLPLITIAALITFNKRKYNLTEHLIIGLYVLAHYSIVSFPITLASLIISPDGYTTVAQVFMLIVFLYFIYVYQRINRYKSGKLILKSVLFTILLTFLFFGLIIAVMILLFATGVLESTDFAPPK